MVEGLLPGAPTGRESLAAKEGSANISALSVLVSGRWDITRDPVCLPGCKVSEQLTVGFARDINVIRFRAAPIDTVLAPPRQLEIKSSFKTSQRSNKCSAQKLALHLMQADKGLSNSTCAEEQGGDNDGFYLTKVGIIFILCNKSLVVYIQGTTVQFIP